MKEGTSVTLHSLGLECLCSVLKCMVEWSRDHYIDPATTGLNAVFQSSSSPGDIPDDQTQETLIVTETLRVGRTGSMTLRGSSTDIGWCSFT